MNGKLAEEYEQFKNSGRKLDMSRGKPSKKQLEIANDMLGILKDGSECVSENGLDCRNYGGLDGIPEAKRFFGRILGVAEKSVLVGGNSSLNMMFDLISHAYIKGIRGCSPWKNGNPKFICPSPGYDRHFAVTEYFGIELISVPMTPTGPDMDAVEKLIADPEVKGIWNVPKYSNPTGVTYSPDTVRRFAALKPAAADFCVVWDNAYCIHDLTDTPDVLVNIFDEAEKYGSGDMFYEFASTSKVTFGGGGICCVASTEKNIKELVADLKFRTICFDKLNMLRHTMLLPDAEAVKRIMAEHRAIIADKFALCFDYFEKELSSVPGVSWTKPNGGYFITLYTPRGKAKRIVSLAADAGLALTPAGAGFPYNRDPDDNVIRIAPTYPENAELENALKLLCLCVRAASEE